MAPDIVIESNIPFAKGLFDDVARVRYLRPEEITPEAMKEADALMTRTRTRCDARLLEGSRCRIIASATIGLDHVDEAYCLSRGIRVENAPGCNAPAVAQYVLASLISIYGAEELRGKVIGIVGVGHVGSIVARWSRHLGMTVLACDPPRAEAEGSEGFSTLDQVARQADIITFHTPYIPSGELSTRHLCGEEFLQNVVRKPLIINSARGPITDTAALKRAMADGRVSCVVIDCWENEPDIDRQLLAEAAIATPHIAGYSLQGKVRATRMAAEAIARELGLPLPKMELQVPPGAAENPSAEEIAASYDPMADTRSLRSCPENFESLRNNYALRCEAGVAHLQ